MISDVFKKLNTGKRREVGDVAFMRGGRVVGFLEDEKSTTSLSKIMLMESR